MTISSYNKASDDPLFINVPLFTKTAPLQNVVITPNFPESDNFTLSDKDIFVKQSLDKPLHMEEILNNADSKSLKVAITIEKMQIKASDMDTYDKKYIKFDLLVLIPLDMKVTNEIPAEINVSNDIRAKYVALDLGDALKKNSKEGDLFGRKEGEDNALKDITYVSVSIKFSKSDINVIDPNNLAVLVTTENGSRLMEFKDNASLKLEGAFLNDIPFSPQFNVLLEKEQGGSSGSIKILRSDNPSFDFKLYVEAKAALEYTLDF